MKALTISDIGEAIETPATDAPDSAALGFRANTDMGGYEVRFRKRAFKKLVDRLNDTLVSSAGIAADGPRWPRHQCTFSLSASALACRRSMGSTVAIHVTPVEDGRSTEGAAKDDRDRQARAKAARA
jgi:hypothetical protein